MSLKLKFILGLNVFQVAMFAIIYALPDNSPFAKTIENLKGFSSGVALVMAFALFVVLYIEYSPKCKPDSSNE